MNRYLYYKAKEENYLMHHGIKGQKWGVRRYQNPDGTLTEEGKRRYGNKQNFEIAKKANKYLKDQLVGPEMVDDPELVMLGSWDAVDLYSKTHLSEERKNELAELIYEDFYDGHVPTPESDNEKKKEKGKKAAQIALTALAVTGATVGAIAISNGIKASKEKKKLQEEIDDLDTQMKIIESKQTYEDSSPAYREYEANKRAIEKEAAEYEKEMRKKLDNTLKGRYNK